VLKDHADALASRPELGFPRAAQFLARHRDQSGVWALQHVHGTYQGRFAGPALADNAENFAVSNVQADIVQRMDGGVPRPEGLGDMAERNHEFPTAVSDTTVKSHQKGRQCRIDDACRSWDRTSAVYATLPEALVKANSLLPFVKQADGCVATSCRG
jgi:hypothetical protein